MFEFLYNYKNSMIVNTLLVTIITMLAGDIRTTVIFIYSLVKKLAFRLPKMISYGKVSQVKISAITSSVSDKLNMTNSPEYEAVIYKLRQLNINLENVKYCHPATPCNKILKYNDNFVEFIENVDKIIINKDIYLSSYYSENKSIAKDNNLSDQFFYSRALPTMEPVEKTSVNHTICLQSKTLSTREIIRQLEEWIAEYKQYSRDFMERNGIAYITVTTKDMTRIGGSNVIYNISKFSSNKTFDTIFFPNKDSVIRSIDKFINSEEMYRIKGIPYNLGILLYGEPGCGKSSFIKAFANYTNRHIMQINLSDIEMCEDFEKIMTDTEILQYNVPVEKRIIVIEDIDAMVDYLGDRSKENNNKLDENVSVNLSILSAVENLNNKISGVQNKKKTSNLNLSYILNILDGINEQKGRIIIISTNYPDKLDKALIRPGRFDIKINFSKCTNETIHQMINHYYDTTIDPNIKFTENKFTPAEIMNKFIVRDTDLDEVISYLQN